MSTIIENLPRETNISVTNVVSHDSVSKLLVPYSYDILAFAPKCDTCKLVSILESLAINTLDAIISLNLRIIQQKLHLLSLLTSAPVCTFFNTF